MSKGLTAHRVLTMAALYQPSSSYANAHDPPTDEKVDVVHAEHLVSDADSEASEAHLFTQEENKRVLRKIDWNMLPLFCIIVALMFVSSARFRVL